MKNFTICSQLGIKYEDFTYEKFYYLFTVRNKIRKMNEFKIYCNTVLKFL